MCHRGEFTPIGGKVGKEAAHAKGVALRKLREMNEAKPRPGTSKRGKGLRYFP